MSHPKKQHGLKQFRKGLVLGIAFCAYGFSMMIVEWLPPFFLGPFELSMEYALFLPLILCIFFHPLYAAFGAALAELVISSIFLGHFEGLMMIGRAVSLFAALWMGGIMVKNPGNKVQIIVAAFAVVLVFQSANTLMSLAQLAEAAGNLGVVPGLPKLMIMMEGFVFFKTVLVSGVLYTVLPSVLLIPYFYRSSRPSPPGETMEIGVLKPARQE